MAGATRYSPGFSRPGNPVLRRPPRRLAPPGARPRKVRLPAEAMEELRVAARRSRRLIARLERASGSIDAEQRLIQRATMGWTAAEQAAIADLGYQGWLERQLDYEAIDDRWLEDILAEALPTLAMSPAQLLDRYRGNPGRPIFELVTAALFRAVYSPRQLFERLAIFWSDHFSIDLFADAGYLLKPTDDREVVRRHALGSFRKMLLSSARSPAMLSYLTNDSNVVGHPNENYARELMELHTLGVDNGYTEKDVKEVARCFTGWSFYRAQAGGDFGRFVFRPLQHDGGRKRVLGRDIPAAGGVADGERVIEILGGSSRTSKFIARKLLVYLWGYEPKRSAVKAVARTYRQTGGDIRAMLRKALERNRMSNATPKLKRPFHLMASSIRALGGDVTRSGELLEDLFIAGHLPFHWAPPNGYPDSEGYWSGFVLPRWNFAASALGGKKPAIDVDPALLETDRPPDRVVSEIDTRLLNSTMTAATREALTGFLAEQGVSKKSIRETIGLAVSAVDFQYY